MLMLAKSIIIYIQAYIYCTVYNSQKYKINYDEVETGDMHVNAFL